MRSFDESQGAPVRRPRRPAAPPSAFPTGVFPTGAFLAGTVLLAATVLPAGGTARLAAQEAAPAPPATDAALPEVPLGDEQAAVSDRLRRLEDALLKMAKYLRRTEPERADLILRALQRSKKERLEDRMRAVSELLRGTPDSDGPRYAEAIREQESLLGGMRQVLGLLRSQDRQKELDAERDRLKGLLKDVNRVLSDQKAAEAATRRGEHAAKVGERQQGVERRTGKLIERIREDDAAQGADGEGDARDRDAEPEDGRDADGQDADGRGGQPPGESGESESEQGQGTDGEPGEPREGSESEPRDPGETPESKGGTRRTGRRETAGRRGAAGRGAG